VGAFFGSVIAEPFDWRAGHTPDLPLVRAATLTLASQARLPQVMGANMAFKRETLADIGGFDPFMGPGSPLENGEDIDAAYRVLLQGYEVVVSPSPTVTHFGFRSFASGEWRDALRGGHVGLGAHMGKHIRCGDMRAAITCLESLYDSTQLVWRNWLNGQRPLGFSRFAYTVFGIVRSLRYGVDRDVRVFRARRAVNRSTAPGQDSCVDSTTTIAG
jgi:hypothetical protein